jgi:hypothetical protein
VNAANGDSQAAFTNLLGVLAANANQSQASRVNQVQMDRGTALNNVNAQSLGLGTGINQARAGAQNQWQQQDNERRYQNSMMAQQWARETAQRNQDLANQTRQANWQQTNQTRQNNWQLGNDTRQANWQQQNATNQANWQNQNSQWQTRLQPILDLIGSGKGLNMASLTALLNRK